jgi:hypothetical protein
MYVSVRGIDFVSFYDVFNVFLKCSDIVVFLKCSDIVVFLKCSDIVVFFALHFITSHYFVSLV